jgi:hypothetical protein
MVRGWTLINAFHQPKQLFPPIYSEFCWNINTDRHGRTAPVTPAKVTGFDQTGTLASDPFAKNGSLQNPVDKNLPQRTRRKTSQGE